MSCQLGTIANIQDVSGIIKYLFPEQIQDEKKFESLDDGWKDSEWNWDVDDETKGSSNDLESLTSQPSSSTSWLQGLCMSLSPTGDLMVFAREERIVYLAQKWDSRQEDVQTKYSVVYEGSPIHQPGETITSVLCLPLASQKRSLEGSPDWTCVIVGFSTGYVRIYTENGTLLISQIFSEEPVVQLKCTTYAQPRNNREGERAEEICFLYPQSLVLIDGFSFYQALKACKNQAARAAATGSDIVDSPLLAYKKWGFTDQENSTDMVPCGYVQPTVFDQMVQDSISKGQNSGIRSSLYGSHLYLNVGRGPYINFYHTVQTSIQPQLSDVTKVVANKLKTAFLSAASGWLGIGGGNNAGTEVKEKKLKIEPDVPLTARYGMYDKRRVGDRVCLSPDYKMAATTDSFGRVILLDAARGVAVRIWKGYRDAQVGWIESTETQELQDSSEGAMNSLNHEKKKMRRKMKSHPNELRRTCFLVIYAPRRGILEVWSAQSGPRVAAFSVPKTARLIYPGHGMLGLNNAIVSRSSSSPHHHHHHHHHGASEAGRNRFDGLFFVDVDGSIKNLSVPFHLVFSGKNSKRTRDAHLLKQLVVLLKGNKMDSSVLKSDIMVLYKDIKTCFSQRQFLEKVLSTKYLKSSTLKEIVEHAIKMSKKSSDGNDPELLSLSRWCDFKSSLLDLYDDLSSLSDRHDDGRHDDPCEDTKECMMEVLTDQLKLEEHEASCLTAVLHRRLAINKLTLPSSTNQKSVTFEEKYMTPEEFLCCFELRRKVSKSGDANQKSKDRDKDKDKMVGDDDGRTDYPDDVEHEHGDEGRRDKGIEDLSDGADDDVPSSGDAEYSVTLVKNLTDSKMNDLGEFMFESLTSNRTSDLEKLRILLVEGPLLCEDLLNLLVTYALSLNLPSLKIIRPLMFIESSIINAIANRKLDDSLSDFLLDNYASLCSRSENIFLALILVLIGRFLSCQSSPDNPGRDLNPSWEEVTMTKEKWSQLTRQYQDLLVVDNLLRAQEFKSVVGREGSKPVRISLERIVQDGRGVIPETIGKFISSLNIPVKAFFPAPPPVAAIANRVEDSSEDSSPSDTAATTTSTTPCEESKSVMVSHSSSSMSLSRGVDDDALHEISVGLDEVRRHLPLTASNNIMLANSCWEFVANWNRDPEVTQLLDLALEYLQKVEDTTLQCGLAKMIWEMFLVKRLSSAVLLTEKVGKAPKDRLIRKDVGLSEKSLSSFISFSLELLDIFLADKEPKGATSTSPNTSLDESTDDPNLLYDVEDAWLDYSRGRNSSLLELATNQLPADSILILHHRTLCIVLKAITSFSVKSIKLFSLFDSKGRNAFFKPLHQSSIDSIDVFDESVKAARLNFLERIITMTVCLLGDASLHDFQYDTPSITNDSGYSDWFKLVTELTQLFMVDPDFTIVRFAYQLLLSGYDAIAIEVLLPINDRSQAGKFLMPVLGARLSSVVFCPDARIQARRTCISSTCLINWLRTVDPKILRCTTVPLPWTTALSKLLTNLVDDDLPEFSLVKEAFDVIPNFE